MPIPNLSVQPVPLNLPTLAPGQAQTPAAGLPANLPRIGQAPPAPAGRKAAPAVGTTINGYTYMGGDPRSRDPKVWAPATGDTFLNSLPISDTQKAVVKAIANYDLPPGSQRGGLGSPEVQQLLGLAKQYDPDFSSGDYVNRQQVRQAFLKGDYSKSVTALSTAIDHARQLADQAKALNNSSSPAWNWLANNYDQYVKGDPRQSNFKQIAQLEAGEVVKAISNGQGGEGDREQAVANYPLNGSPAQQQGAIATTVNLLKSKLDELNNTYQRGMGRQHSVMELLSPSARKSWQVLTQQYGVAGPNGQAGQQQPQSQSGRTGPRTIRFQDLP